MSELVRITPDTPERTVFESVWHKNENGLYLFRSDEHEVMALADRYPKLPLQVVIAPSEGSAGANVHFAELPRHMKRSLHEVADDMEAKMFAYLKGAGLDENQRVITHEVSPVKKDQSVTTHTEGFGVRDHAHIVMFTGERQQGRRLYEGKDAVLGKDAVRRTIELLTFSEEESADLERRLGQLAQIQ